MLVMMWVQYHPLHAVGDLAFLQIFTQMLHY